MRPGSILIILFLYHTCLFAQNHVSLLKVSVNDCRDGRVAWAQELKFYKLPENILYHTMRPYKFRDGQIRIPYFIPGTYRVEHSNVFGEKIEKVYQLDDCDSNQLTICVDELPEQSENSLEKLNENDSITIDFSSFGCFHRSGEKIVITRRNNYYEAKIYPTISRIFLNEEQKDAGTEIIILSDKQIRDLKEFENGLNRIKGDGGCTTTDRYVVTTKWGIKKVDDSRCQWNGFWYLKRSLTNKK